MRRLVAALALAFLAAGLTGCLGSQDPSENPEEPPSGDDETPEARTGTLALSSCELVCFEPNVDVGPDGTVYVANALGDLSRSTDGGRTFEELGRVPLPPGAEDFQVQLDGLVDVAADGTVYYSALLNQLVETVRGTFTLPGIQVAASPDGGETWPTNTYVSAESEDPEPTYEVDRQWLAFGPDGTVYLSYAQQSTQDCRAGSGVWVARSDDGGSSFSSFQRAAPYESRFACGQAGPPVPVGEDQVLLPYWANRPDPTPADTERGIDLAFSDDRGESFDQREAVTTEGGFFPVLADTDQGISMAYEGPEDSVQTASAPGGDWLEPTTWTRADNASVTSPWITTGPDGRVAIGWATGTESGAVLHVQRVAATGHGLEPVGPVVDVAEIESNSSNPANTHFVDLAFTPTGALATAYAPGDGTVRFARLAG